MNYGGVGNTKILDNNTSIKDFMAEASRQGLDENELQAELEDYVTSSYGGGALGNKITDFIEKAPKSMMYNGGTLYRGLYFNSQKELDNFINSHKVGDTLATRKDGLSWTASQDIAKEFSSNAGDYHVILVNNDNNRIAIGIKNIADTPISSEEVLYSNKVDFTITKVEKRGETVYLHTKQKRSK